MLSLFLPRRNLPRQCPKQSQRISKVFPKQSQALLTALWMAVTALIGLYAWYQDMQLGPNSVVAHLSEFAVVTHLSWWFIVLWWHVVCCSYVCVCCSMPIIIWCMGSWVCLQIWSQNQMVRENIRWFLSMRSTNMEFWVCRYAVCSDTSHRHISHNNVWDGAATARNITYICLWGIVSVGLGVMAIISDLIPVITGVLTFDVFGLLVMISVPLVYFLAGAFAWHLYNDYREDHGKKAAQFDPFKHLGVDMRRRDLKVTGIFFKWGSIDAIPARWPLLYQVQYFFS